MSGSLEKRFYRKVSTAKTRDGCLLWNAATNGKYGLIRSSKKPHKWILAHRVAYELHFGQIKNDLLVLHKCDNPLCVNWEHLFVGNHKDNSADMILKNRQKRSRFNETDMERIRDKRALGVSQQEISDSYGVSRPLISLILSGKVSRLQTNNQ